MTAFFKLIRWPNILMIWITMGLVLFALINPILSLRPFEAGMNATQFLLLVAAVTFIAVAGYLINDIHDMDADAVNKPGKNVVGRKISVHTVRILYWVFNILGVAAGTASAWMLGQINYSLIFILSAGLLWFYSGRYQCQPLIGNLVVAFLSSLTIMLVWLFDFLTLMQRSDIMISIHQFLPQVNALILLFTAFAFMTTLIRELVKDMQDFAGDDRFGCRTLAVAAGVDKAKRITMFLLVAMVLLALYSQWYFFQTGFINLFYFFMLIDLLIFGVIFRLARAGDTKDFKRVSFLIKILMLAGIFSMIFVYLTY
jgi:4-hydroxybenzoate polyprenyltransferase